MTDPAALGSQAAAVRLLAREVRMRAAAVRGQACEQRALAGSRRLGMALGILMCRDQLTEEQAFAVLKTESQRRNRKARDLAESLVYTGTL